jgi:flagellar basal-body rod modification protein FlgD
MSTVQSTGAMPTDLLAAMNGKKKAGTDSTTEAADKFMTLLITQMRNQDPLNPMDNAQVTSQLAQLSTVSGINQLNSTLEALQGSYQATQSLQAVNMIGHGVFAPGNKLTLKDENALFGVELAEPADSVKLTIRDDAGVAVHTITLDAQQAGVLPLHWDGTTDSGAAAENGVYTVEVEARRAGEKVDARTLGFGEVTSVTTGAQGVKLSVPGVGEITLADIRQVI